MSKTETDASGPLLGNGYFQPYCLEILQTLLPSNGAGGDNGDRVRTVGLTSCHGGEGVSTLASNLAVAAAGARSGRVLLVDAHLAMPRLHALFGLARSPGLANVLAGHDAVKGTCRATRVANLSLLTAGESKGALRADGLSLEGLPDLLETVKQDYELVLLDLPPIEESAVPAALFQVIDGVLLVAESERVRQETLSRAGRILEYVGASVLGVVVNKQRRYIPRWLDHLLGAHP